MRKSWSQQPGPNPSQYPPSMSQYREPISTRVSHKSPSGADSHYRSSSVGTPLPSGPDVNPNQDSDEETEQGDSGDEVHELEPINVHNGAPNTPFVLPSHQPTTLTKFNKFQNMQREERVKLQLRTRK